MQRRSASGPSSDVATFVLVHGGGHGGWCWQFVARNLTAQGHRVFAPTLTGVGDKLHLGSGDLTLDTHIEDVLSLLWDENLSDVILVGHSYGGMVITGVADGAASRIRRLVYLDAAIPADGEALLDISPGLNAFNDVREVGGVRLGLWPDPVIVSRIYGIADEKLSQWVLAQLTPHPWATFETKLHLADRAAVDRLPRAIINCKATLQLRPDQLRHRWLDGDFVRELDVGHDLMITEPDAVSALLLEIAGL